MRVVGYVRDTPDPSEAEPAFAQAERVRRWINDSGHQLVAICQDVRTAGRHLGRDGYRAMMGIVTSGEAQAVLLPSLEALSPDKVTQEIMLWDLRARGVSVISTSEDDLAQLSDPPADSLRILIRDVLAKVGTHVEMIGSSAIPMMAEAIPELPAAQAPLPQPAPEDAIDETDVVIELIPPGANTDPFKKGQVTPAL